MTDPISDRRLLDYAEGNSPFYVWLLRVNDVIEDVAGVHLLDLPDYLYRDAFEDGDSPADVAARVLEQA